MEIHAIIGQLLGDPHQLAGHDPADSAEDRRSDHHDDNHRRDTPQPEAVQIEDRWREQEIER